MFFSSSYLFPVLVFLFLAGCLIVVSCFLLLLCASNSSVFICFCLCFVALVQTSISAPLGENTNRLFRGPGRNRRNKLFKSTPIPMFCVCFVFACPCPALFESTNGLVENNMGCLWRSGCCSVCLVRVVCYYNVHVCLCVCM